MYPVENLGSLDRLSGWHKRGADDAAVLLAEATALRASRSDNPAETAALIKSLASASMMPFSAARQAAQNRILFLWRSAAPAT
jgi:hypothetical protein